MCELCKKNKKLTEDKAIIINTMEATTPELGSVGFWSPKSSSFSGSDSIVVEEAARNFLSPWPSIKQSGAPNFFVQHDKVEDSKLSRYLETCGRALEQFLQRQTSSNDSIVFLLGMAFDQLVRGLISLRERAQSVFRTHPRVAQYSGNESSCNLQRFGVKNVTVGGDDHR